MIDCGVFSPAGAFKELFKEEGVEVTSQEARGPMGMHKRVSTPPPHLLNVNSLDYITTLLDVICEKPSKDTISSNESV